MVLRVTVTTVVQQWQALTNSEAYYFYYRFFFKFLFKIEKKQQFWMSIQ